MSAVGVALGKIDLGLPNYFIAEDPCWVELINKVSKVAPLSWPILIQGGTGVGKNLIAKLLHKRSCRAGNLEQVDCATLPSGLVDSELYGSIKGAYTGSTISKTGLVSKAQNGTLVIDEIHALNYEEQAKLLRLIGERKYRSVGSTEETSSNARIIALTNVDLGNEMKEKRFREDLYYRFEYQIIVPDLKDRRADILPLLHHYISKNELNRGGRLKLGVTESLSKLKDYDWPGNVRQLIRVVNSALVGLEDTATELSTDDLIPHLQVSTKVESSLESLPISASGLNLKELEKKRIERVLLQVKWNRTKAASLLGLNYKTLLNKIRRFGISI